MTKDFREEYRDLSGKIYILLEEYIKTSLNLSAYRVDYMDELRRGIWLEDGVYIEVCLGVNNSVTWIEFPDGMKIKPFTFLGRNISLMLNTPDNIVFSREDKNYFIPGVYPSFKDKKSIPKSIHYKGKIYICDTIKLIYYTI